MNFVVVRGVTNVNFNDFSYSVRYQKQGVTHVSCTKRRLYKDCTQCDSCGYITGGGLEIVASGSVEPGALGVGAGRPGGGRPPPATGIRGYNPRKVFGNLHYCRRIFVPF